MLPDVNDSAYDLNCDGKLTADRYTYSTGKLVDGKLEIVPYCDETQIAILDCHCASDSSRPSANRQ